MRMMLVLLADAQFGGSECLLLLLVWPEVVQCVVENEPARDEDREAHEYRGED